MAVVVVAVLVMMAIPVLMVASSVFAVRNEGVR